MEEELGTILANEELDNEAKQKAIQSLIGSNFVDRNKYNDVKNNTNAKQKEYEDLKAELDTLKQSKMTDEEKIKANAIAKENELKEIRKQLNEATAKSIFADAGISKDVYEGLLESVVKEDTERTKASANAICLALATQKEAIEKNMKDKIVESTPTPPAGNDNNEGTADELEVYRKELEKARKDNNMVKKAYYTRLIQEAERKK